MANAAGFLKKRNGFCTSHTRSAAEALKGRSDVREMETSQVVVASRRMKILPHPSTDAMIPDFRCDPRMKNSRAVNLG